MGKIISFSGSHGTGKTTSAYQKAVDMKIFHPEKSIRAICDMESLCPYHINKDGSQATQMWLFTNQINQELTNLSRFQVLVTDRTVVDVIGYTYALGYHSLATDMLALAGNHVSIYKTIYFKQIRNNSFCHHDGIRDADDMVFRRDVEEAMLLQYDHLIAGGYFRGNIYYV